MEVEEEERIVIAKPVASKPCSSFRSFSALLSGAINSLPHDSLSETVVAAIRPKTVRFKPAVNQASVAVASSQGEVSGTAVGCLSDKVLKPESKSTVVYKPLAKLVSSKTARLLANLGNLDFSHQDTTAPVQAQIQHLDQARHAIQTQVASNCHVKLPLQVKTNQTLERSKMAAPQNLEENQRALVSTTNSDRPISDGYNWRKYGQKQVKGSEYPRSYYKCTHPNCPVKKKVERSLDGQIAEIVYKGEHNHSKPQPPKRQSSVIPEKRLVSDATGQESSNPLWSNPLNERNEGLEGIENINDVGLPVNASYPSKGLNPCDLVMARALNSGHGTPDNSCGLSGDCDEGSRGLDAEDDDTKCKRRKAVHQPNDVGILGQGVREPRIVLQNSFDSEVLGDGFRWRKYGQKVVKGNPYPRSYYRCTNQKCNVRKHVERALDDPRAFITTYEGKHNHEMPASRNLNPMVSDPHSAAPANNSKL